MKKLQVQKNKIISISIWYYVIFLIVGAVLILLGFHYTLDVLTSIGCGIVSSLIIAFVLDLLNTKNNYNKDKRIIAYAIHKSAKYCENFVYFIIDIVNKDHTNQQTMMFHEWLQKACNILIYVCDESDTVTYPSGQVIVAYLEKFQNIVEEDVLYLKSIIENSLAIQKINELNTLTSIIKNIVNSTQLDLLDISKRNYLKLNNIIEENLVPEIIKVFPEYKSLFDFPIASRKQVKLF